MQGGPGRELDLALPCEPAECAEVPQEMELPALVGAIACSFSGADTLGPVWVSQRSGRVYSPGIGPHAENAAVRTDAGAVGEARRLLGRTDGSVPA